MGHYVLDLAIHQIEFPCWKGLPEDVANAEGRKYTLIPVSAPRDYQLPAAKEKRSAVRGLEADGNRSESLLIVETKRQEKGEGLEVYDSPRLDLGGTHYVMDGGTGQIRAMPVLVLWHVL